MSKVFEFLEKTLKNGTSDGWHYYISSKRLRAQELLKHAVRNGVSKSMHWLLDVHFGEDHCCIQDEDVLKNLNIIRKIVLNFLHVYRNKINSKRSFSNIMPDCLIDPIFILEIYFFKIDFRARKA